MNTEIFKVTAGSLLHDIGKILYRAGADTRSHPVSGAEFVGMYTEDPDILDCIRYHHRQDLLNAAIGPDSPAFIVYIADNISAGLDRREREIEGDSVKPTQFDKGIPLESVFNILNGNNGSDIFKPAEISRESGINYPRVRGSYKISQGSYAQILQHIRAGLSSISFEPDYINSILEIFEAHLSFVPSSTNVKEMADISLFDHAKTTAAIAACICSYLSCNNVKDFKELFLSNEEGFYSEKAFMMMSCDMSGIQKFLYAIPVDGAMKSLRSRSFYLEILMEHIADLVLKETGFSRANLIYTGGGHAYILLPNCTDIRFIVENTFREVNKWLAGKFGTLLYIAHALQDCSANDLMNRPHDESPYRKIFSGLSAKLSLVKLKRYGPNEIRAMNLQGSTGNSGRECKVCGTVGGLIEDNGAHICHICKNFKDISNDLIKDNMVILVSDERPHSCAALQLPGVGGKEYSAIPMSESRARDYLENSGSRVFGIYGKNRMYTCLKLSTRIWMGDYCLKTTENASSNNAVATIATFKELADKSTGKKQLAVLRADVDNLGRAFVSGFVRPDEPDAGKKYAYQTISRTASLSRMLSHFFKLYINSITDKPHNLHDSYEKRFSMTGNKDMDGRSLVIVYSGGDDVFIVGAWDEVIEAAIDIRRAFARFCGGTLHLSAGIGVFPYSYPVHLMASKTAELENTAKQVDGKNSVALFGNELDVRKGTLTYRHVYKWEDLEKKVIGEKLKILQDYIDEDDSAGTARLHRFLQLARGMDDDRINLARFAYQLGKLQPGKSEESGKQERYDKFCRQMYEWFANDNERAQLVTALNMMLYLKKDKEQGKE
jgi:CRISPR-associated protein Csm1